MVAKSYNLGRIYSNECNRWPQGSQVELIKVILSFKAWSGAANRTATQEDYNERWTSVPIVGQGGPPGS